MNGQGPSVLGGGVTCSTAVTATSPVGSYASSCSGAADANYNISYVPGSVTVGPATLTVTANNVTKAFGAAVPTLTATISGFVNGQTLATSGVTGQAAVHHHGHHHQPGRHVPDHVLAGDAGGVQLHLQLRGGHPHGDLQLRGRCATTSDRWW